MKRKGFTLIELLAVIVILAIIALITVPMIINVIEKAKRQSFIDSAYGIIEAGEYYYAENILSNPNEIKERYDFEVKNKQFVDSVDNTKVLSFKGEVPKIGMLQVYGNGKTAVAICNGTYCACKSVSELQVTLKEGNCNIDSETGEIGDDLIKDGTPTGMIMSYMTGSTASEGYLACDGSIYNISEYPNLASAIKEGFGSYNHYGGDGETTFAVPDLRGEFLRGTGSNSHENQGSGEEVGTHQDATEVARIFNYQNNTISVEVGNYGWTTPNYDSEVKRDTVRRYKDIGIQSAGTGTYVYTTRPTNTSVLYCIKY